jgi:hypothetical protein
MRFLDFGLNHPAAIRQDQKKVSLHWMRGSFRPGFFTKEKGR